MKIESMSDRPTVAGFFALMHSENKRLGLDVDAQIASMKEQIKQSLEESRANPVAPYFKWETYPAGNMRWRQTRAGESRRRSFRHGLRLKIKRLQGGGAQ
jgi:hypothetical protein